MMTIQKRRRGIIPILSVFVPFNRDSMLQYNDSIVSEHSHRSLREHSLLGNVEVLSSKQVFLSASDYMIRPVGMGGENLQWSEVSDMFVFHVHRLLSITNPVGCGRKSHSKWTYSCQTHSMKGEGFEISIQFLQNGIRQYEGSMRGV